METSPSDSSNSEGGSPVSPGGDDRGSGASSHGNSARREGSRGKRRERPSRNPASSALRGGLTPADHAARQAVDAASPLSLRRTFFIAMVGAALLWAAFPPLGWGLLAFVAPAPWVWLACRGVSGKRNWFALYLAGFLFWLATLQGIRLAYWALYFGWIALSAYLAVYVPLFVWLTKVAVRRRWPVVLAAPIVWIGLELLRGRLLTGFSLALLGHSLVDFPLMLQVADLGGAYAVSLAAMCSAASIARGWRTDAARRSRFQARWLLGTAAAVGLLCSYGAVRMTDADSPTLVASNESSDGLNAPRSISSRSDATPPRAIDLSAGDGPSIKVAVVQGAFDTIFENNPERNARSFRDYRDQTLRVMAEHPDADLVVWPESIYAAIGPQLVIEGAPNVPPEVTMSPEEFRERLVEGQEMFNERSRDFAAQINAPDGSRPRRAMMLLGTETIRFRDSIERYNTALLLDADGKPVGQYDKMHPVMFGEYIPGGAWLPWLYKLTPMEGGLSQGKGPTLLEIDGVRLSPNICFESTVPHLLRRHWLELAKNGDPPDALVCLTNDGWFWGSAILDHHLACSALRAVELRRPVIVAANTGVSAVIDENGRVLARGAKRRPCELVAKIRRHDRRSAYQSIGDIPAGLCLAACTCLAFLGWRDQRRRPL